MKRIAFLLLSLLFVINGAYADKKKKVDEDLYKYEVEACSEVPATTGHITFKIWSYGKKKILTNDYCMENAIHAVLFKGIPASGATAGVKALVPEGYEYHEKFFKRFFDGKYLQYVQLSNKGRRDAGDVISLKKKRYKMATTVVVNLKGLRTYLEQEKIIKPLDFLFD